MNIFNDMKLSMFSIVLIALLSSSCSAQGCDCLEGTWYYYDADSSYYEVYVDYDFGIAIYSEDAGDVGASLLGESPSVDSLFSILNQGLDSANCHSVLTNYLTENGRFEVKHLDKINSELFKTKTIPELTDSVSISAVMRKYQFN